MDGRDVKVRTGLRLAALALVMFLLPLVLNLLRGGAEGVGYDPRTQGSALFFAVTYPSTAARGPLQGRLVVVVSLNAPIWPLAEEPEGPTGPYLFWRDVTGWQPGRPIEVTDDAPGLPVPSLAHIPPAHYWVQGIFEPGEAAGRPLPNDWSPEPGDLLSRPVKINVDPRSEDVIRVDLTRVVAAPGPVTP
jgi:hypothetical protein